MKKTFIFLFTVLVFAYSAKADKSASKSEIALENITDNTLRQFGSTFYRASDVTWSINKSYQKASFILNGKTSYAIYDQNSQLLVATQNASFEEIPNKAQTSIKSTYANYKVNKAVKVISRPTDYQFNDDTDHYWISLSNDTKELILLISPGADISVVSTKELGS